MRALVLCTLLTGCAAPTTLHLVSGGTYRPSERESSRFNGSVLLREDLELTAYAGDWGELVACVTDRLEPYGLTVTDEDDPTARYEVAVGGTDRPPIGAMGVAPMLCPPHRNEIAFVFDIGHSTDQVCVAVVHELGHMLGLSHTSDCDDIMQAGWCGSKRIIDEPRLCIGDGCGCGGTHQNAGEVFRAAGEG